MMGFRIRKSLRLLPGVKLNLSKTGASVSLGGKGLTYNIGRKGGRTTVGLPGSGLSYSTYRPRASKTGKFGWIWAIFVLLVIGYTAIFGNSLPVIH